MSQDINLLVVDDVEKNLLAAEALLARPGLKVLKAASGEAALEMLLANEVALALIDVQMPGMDGFELAEIIRGNNRTRAIPLIFMTAAVQEPHRSFQGYQAGAVDFLNKPIEPAILRSKVEVFVELHAQKKQISHQLEELQKALQVNEMFMAVLGHDLRTPLSAVSNGSELIRHLSDDPKIVETANRIQSSSRRMEKMVSQLLDVARVRSGNIVLDIRQAHIGEVCSRIVGELAQSNESARISIETAGDLEARFDVDRMAQVLSNLLGNALQHGLPDTPVRVELDGSQAHQLQVRIGNQGCIPPQTLETIFQPFHAARSENRSAGGLGLGLYIVKRFIEAHGGAVSVRSMPATGTVFELSLPRAA